MCMVHLKGILIHVVVGKKKYMEHWLYKRIEILPQIIKSAIEAVQSQIIDQKTKILNKILF